MLLKDIKASIFNRDAVTANIHKRWNNSFTLFTRNENSKEHNNLCKWWWRDSGYSNKLI